MQGLGFHAAIDYKAQDIGPALGELAPTGVDVFLDNVGGKTLEAVLSHLARGARIVLSGGVSQYNAEQPRGPANYIELIRKRASMIGFITPDYADRYPDARAELAGWLRDGRLISREQIIDGGIRAFPDALLKLFAGENTGKLVLAVSPQLPHEGSDPGKGSSASRTSPALGSTPSLGLRYPTTTA
jgi:NADPH-dependent curcumin reductase CurA